jgi:hypothetical protein
LNLNNREKTIGKKQNRLLRTCGTILRGLIFRLSQSQKARRKTVVRKWAWWSSLLAIVPATQKTEAEAPLELKSLRPA